MGGAPRMAGVAVATPTSLLPHQHFTLLPLLAIPELRSTPDIGTLLMYLAIPSSKMILHPCWCAMTEFCQEPPNFVVFRVVAYCLLCPATYHYISDFLLMPVLCTSVQMSPPHFLLLVHQCKCLPHVLLIIWMYKCLLFLCLSKHLQANVHLCMLVSPIFILICFMFVFPMFDHCGSNDIGLLLTMLFKWPSYHTAVGRYQNYVIGRSSFRIVMKDCWS